MNENNIEFKGYENQGIFRKLVWVNKGVNMMKRVACPLFL
jgi:hypothetical protein